MNFYILWLNKIFNYNINSLTKFLTMTTPEKVFMDNDEIKSLELKEEIKEKLLSSKIRDDAKYEYEYCEKNNIKLVNFTEKDYPINLLNTVSPPPLLYYKGSILPEDEISIAIIGSRKYSEYGKLCTKKFASELASCKVTIISGMAYGTDSFAHLYSIDSKGRTIAVLGSGIDVIYPKENTKLYYDIIENGAVISEFPIGTAPTPKNFPIRNRIVAGMSLGTLVIEASKKSGTMITARLAAEYGRNVYVVPGELFNYNSVGTNSLIKDGAKLVTESNDILQDIYSEISRLVPKPKQLSLFTPTDLNDVENLIYKNISLKPIYIDNLIEKVNLSPVEILSSLTILELKGYVKQLPGKQYVINI